MQQLYAFADSLLPGQDTLRFKTRSTSEEWDGAREYSESKCSGIQLLGVHSEVTSCQVLRNDSECSAPTLSLSARESFRVFRYSGIISSLNSGYSAYKLRKTKKNFKMWQVQAPLERAAFVSACRAPPRPGPGPELGPARFGVCARVYTTQTSVVYLMWD